MEAGHGVSLLLRASWQDGPREERPALLVVHGLGGSDASPYVVSTGRLAWARGWHVVRMNMRGSGDGEALCPLLYNAGPRHRPPRRRLRPLEPGAPAGRGRLLARGEPRAAHPRPPARAASRDSARRRWRSARRSTSRPAPTRSRPPATGCTSATSCRCWRRATASGTGRGRTSSPRAASATCARCASTTSGSPRRSAATRAPRSTTSGRARGRGSPRSTARRSSSPRPTTP